MKFGVLGSGQVGQVLASGLAKHGHEVRIGARSADKLAEFSGRSGIPAGTFAEVAAWGEALVLAVKGTVAVEAMTLAGAGNVHGKLVIDATNPIAEVPPVDGVLRFFTGPDDSLMERLQAAFPAARFVKAFSCVGNGLMVNPQLPGGPPTMFICGNDAEAKAIVRGVLDAFGWETSDMGTAVAARAIEPLCQLWCIPGFRDNQWSHAFRLLRA